MERRPSHTQAAIPCTGLYAMAIGIGGVKVALPAHGAGQLDHSNQRNVSAFFNWLFFFFSFFPPQCTGGFISATVKVCIEENKGWNRSF